MNSDEFHNHMIKHVRRIAAKALSFDGSGLDWDLTAEPVLRLCHRMIREAMVASPFTIELTTNVKNEHDEAQVNVVFSLLSDCEWIDDIDVGGEQKLSSLLLGQLCLYDKEDVLDTVAAIERSCKIVRDKLEAA